MSSKKHNTIEEDADLHIRKMIGQRIKRIRNRWNQSADTLAKKVGVTRNAITQIETGRNNASAVLLWKIACALHCNIVDFFPQVPDSLSMQESDIAQIKTENEEAAKYVSEAYKINEV